MPDWALAYLDDNEPADRIDWMEVDDDLPSLIRRNAGALFGERWAIMYERRSGEWRQVAYSIPYWGIPSEVQQPIYALETNHEDLRVGTLFHATLRRGTGHREVNFKVELPPEHVIWPVPMTTTMHGAMYPTELQQLTRHFRDSSWKNDVTASITFAVGEKPYTVWIQPMSPLRRFEEGPPALYELTELERNKDDGETLEDALDRHQPDYEADTVDFDDPVDLLEYVRSMVGEEDPTAARFALLDLGPKRRSYRPGRDDDPMQDPTAQRFALLDPYEDDPTVNPSRRRRARRNPDDVATAREKYEEFHRHKPMKIWEGPSIVPARVRELGDAKAVLYRSNKNDPDTGRPVKRPINYIHDHDAGVKAYAPAKGGGVEVPKFIRDAEALVVLGKCLGFDFEEGGKVREAKGIKPYPDLCATPCGKALLVIQDRREVIAIIWGGALGVEARGIVG